MKLRDVLLVVLLCPGFVACGGGSSVSTGHTEIRNESEQDFALGDLPIISIPFEPSSPCVRYTRGTRLVGGMLVGDNCVYGVDFVDLDNPLILPPSERVIFRDLPNDGAHVFGGSLVVGQSYNTNADLAAAGITEGGDSTVIQIDAGATLAFQTSEDFLVVNRGSQIFAMGEMNAPITVTSVSDLNGSVDPEGVQEWGGMIIKGFGVTNKCSYAGTRNVDLEVSGECHPGYFSSRVYNSYGGNEDADSSGTLSYMVIKHTGALVEEGVALSGLTLLSVGSGTRVDHVQVYSAYSDGLEIVGGAVNVDRFISLYAKDDGIDIDEGYIGTIDYALLLQSETDGNRCVEADGIAAYHFKTQASIDGAIARKLNSTAKIRNLTCIFSANESIANDSVLGTGKIDPGQGIRIRESYFGVFENSIVNGAYGPDIKTADAEHNYCVRIDHGSEQAALDGNLQVASSVFACQDLKAGDLEGTSTLDWLNLTNFTYQSAEAGDDPTAATNGDLVILDGYYSVALADMRVGDSATAPAITLTERRTFIGAVTADNDWTAGWAYGLENTNRGQALWFE